MLSKGDIKNLGYWINEWKEDYIPREEEFVYTVGGYGIRLLRGYVPNFDVIPAGWVETVHNLSGTKHVFYFEFKDLQLLDTVAMAEHQIELSIEHYEQEIKKTCNDILGTNYTVNKVSKFKLDIKPYFKGFNETIILPSGLVIANFASNSEAPFYHCELIELGVLYLNQVKTTTKSYLVNPFHTPKTTLSNLEPVIKQIASFIAEASPDYKGKILQYHLYNTPGVEITI